MSPQSRAKTPAKQQVDRVERARKDVIFYASALTIMVLSLLLLIATIVIHAQFYMLFAYLGGMFFTVAMVAKLIESLLEHKEALHQDSNSNH